MLPNLSPMLQEGQEQLGIGLSLDAQQKMLQFLELLAQWNKTYNLTAITNPTKMVTHHLLDSLAILPYLYGQIILDVGTGAGLPGLPLAIACPHKKFVLLDSRSKKTLFLKHVRLLLSLTNVEIVQAKAKDYKSSCFDVILSRALGTFSYIIQETEHLICPSGSWLMMKGKIDDQELSTLKRSYQIHPLNVPGLTSERHLVIVPS